MSIKEQLDKEGYVILRGFFDKISLLKILIEAGDVFDIQAKHRGYIDHTLKEQMIGLFQTQEEIFKNCGKLIQTGLPSLYNLATDPTLLNTLQTLGINWPFMCTRPVLFFNHPKLASSPEYYKTPPHQDWPSMEASQNSLVVWVPLVDVNEQNGSIILYPGSHKLGILPFTSEGGFAQVKRPDIEPTQPSLNVGDIAIFSTKLIHESGDILDDSIRWSCHFRFTDMSEDDFIQRGYPSPYIYSPITKQKASR